VPVEVEVDEPTTSKVVSLRGDVVVVLLDDAMAALAFAPPFLEEGWSKNRPWKTRSIVTEKVLSESSARGMMWSRHPHLQKWGASMFLSTILTIVPAVESMVELAGELVGKNDILPKDSTSSGNLASPKPAFLNMHVLESQRHHPSPKSLVGMADMQNAQWECVHPEQKTLGRLTEDDADDVADVNFSADFPIVVVWARTTPRDPSTLGIFGSDAMEDSEPQEGWENMFLLDALLDATTVPDEEDDVVEIDVVDIALKGVPEIEVKMKLRWVVKMLGVEVDPNTDAKLCGAVLIRAPRDGTTGGAAHVDTTSIGDSQTVMTSSISTEDIIQIY